jgi:hypothetical protein
MPYEHIEQIGDRSEERFALGLGARNVAGLVVSGFPILMVSGNWPIGLRIPALLLALAFGFLATVQIGGLPAYAWPLWWLRGRIRMLAQGRTISPDQLPGIAQTAIRAPLRTAGPIRVARRASVRSRGPRSGTQD